MMTLHTINKKYIVFAFITLLVIALFVTVRISQQRQANQSKASATTSLVLSPEQITAPQGSTFNVDLSVDPGQNIVSIVDAHIQVNPNVEFQQLQINTQSFPVTLRDPSVTDGILSFSVNIGSDVTHAIQTRTKVATLTFLAKSSETATASAISVLNSSRIFSVASSDQPNENVLANVNAVNVDISENTNPCADGIYSWHVNDLCEDGSTHHTGDYVCTDGTRGTVGSPGTCTSSVSLQAQARTICANSPKVCPSLTSAVTPTPTTPPTPNCGDATGRPDLCTCLINGTVNQCANSCQNTIGSSSNTDGVCCPTGQQYCKSTGVCTANSASCPNNGTSLSVQFALPGIGNRPGDNSHPKHPTRDVTVSVLDAANNLVIQKTGQAVFNGNIYSTTVPLGSILSGTYQTVLAVDNSLQKKAASLLTITASTANQNPGIVTLTSGDLKHENVLDLLDWNMMLGCYNAPMTDQNLCRLSDLNDDGKVDEIDVNILQRGFAIREGDSIGETITPTPTAVVSTPTPTSLAVCHTIVLCPTGQHSISDMPNPNTSCPTNHCAPDFLGVSITNSSFVSDNVTVEAGTAIKWTNNDTIAHTVTADDGSFDSGTLQPGDTFRFMPHTSVSYHCSIHPSMHGSIGVVIQ